MVFVADAVLASAVSLWSTLFQTIMEALVRLGRCLRHASAYGCSWKNFLPLVLALFALGIWCFISVFLSLAVTVPGVWVLLMSTKIGFFARRLSSWEQCLVLQWIHALRQFFGYGRISHIFNDAADLNPGAFLLCGTISANMGSILQYRIYQYLSVSIR